MERQDLYYVLTEQQKDFNKPKNLVKRELTSRIAELARLNMPIIITGVRRCGKSCLLKLIKEEFQLKEKEYLYINFNDERLINFSSEDFQKILDFLNESDYKKKTVLFIDEIQETTSWEKWIDRIKEKHIIFITGSNSKLLSKEISTILTGRSINLQLTPFNFTEYLSSKNINIANWKNDIEIQSKIRAEFKKYADGGGLPQVVLSGEKILLSELYENILYRDIIKRFNVNLEKPIKEISSFLLSNATSSLMMRSLTKLQEIKNLSTLKHVLTSFENAFLFFFINKFDYSIKKQTQNPKKIYCIDNGFITALGFRFSEDKGKLLENLAAIRLKKDLKEIFYFKKNHECDFIIKEGIRVVNAIQVCYEINNSNKEREFSGLFEALDEFNLKKGLILTYDQHYTEKSKGREINVIPMWKWLLEGNINERNKQAA